MEKNLWVQKFSTSSYSYKTFIEDFWSGNDARILEKQFIRAAEIIRLNTKKQDTVFGDYYASGILAILSDRGITFNEI